jgi:hypothetical protein
MTNPRRRMSPKTLNTPVTYVSAVALGPSEQDFVVAMCQILLGGRHGKAVAKKIGIVYRVMKPVRHKMAILLVRSRKIRR